MRSLSSLWEQWQQQLLRNSDSVPLSHWGCDPIMLPALRPSWAPTPTSYKTTAHVTSILLFITCCAESLRSQHGSTVPSTLAGDR